MKTRSEIIQEGLDYICETVMSGGDVPDLGWEYPRLVQATLDAWEVEGRSMMMEAQDAHECQTNPMSYYGLTSGMFA